MARRVRSTGVFESSGPVNVETLAWPMLLAILSRHDRRLRREHVGERARSAAFLRIAGGIAFAGTFFLGPGLLLGITSALRHGGGALISFIVLFGVVNALGAVAGPALLAVTWTGGSRRAWPNRRLDPTRCGLQRCLALPRPWIWRCSCCCAHAGGLPSYGPKWAPVLQAMKKRLPPVLDGHSRASFRRSE